ncbi:hypothetical protein EDC56_0519 [Sinobacterium caligoides]|uniref:Uncharacterized protein n=1 Tax=Sinobacterium caligoides TaxID=933926 RepID=A0A3N2DYR4_9GAMM|nr:hypothetical protein EDC56_0519 [Sinobacterium caligoides]
MPKREYFIQKLQHCFLISHPYINKKISSLILGITAIHITMAQRSSILEGSSAVLH